MDQELLTVRLEDIYFPTKLRLRSDYGDVEELAQSMVRRGQIQPIVLRPFEQEEFPKADPHMWMLVDGGRRLFAAMIIYKNEKEIPNVDSGAILAIPRDDVDPMFALEIEFHANEDRKKFHWKEKISYIVRVHKHFKSMDKNWDVKHTANLVQLGDRATYAYLQMAANPEILAHEKVQKQKSFRVAYKQFQIIAEELNRKAKVVMSKGGNKALAEIVRQNQAKLKDASDIKANEEKAARIERSITGAKNLVSLGDCRDWIKQFSDEQFAWVHWDPPYGHRQGERDSVHGSIQDDQDYARDLMGAMLPEIWRVLQQGHWLVVWHHAEEYEWLKSTLESNNFWVNPYPCIWHKQRASDGHEIKRFLINDYEQFFLAAKITSKKDDPILPNTDRSNVFTTRTLARADRRHVTHKPPKLLTEILDVVSYRGELGCDPSVGSGSLIEAALYSGRMALGCELDEAYYLGAVEAIQNILDGKTNDDGAN